MAKKVSDLKSAALTQKVANRHADWLERLPHLENDEARLLQLIEKCYTSFLSGNGTAKDVAVEYNIPVDLVSTWARQGKWMRRREEFRQELLVNVEMDYAEFVRKNRVRIAEEIVAGVGPRISQISDAIQSALDSEEYKYVRSLSESLKHVSELVTKAVALDGNLPSSDRPNIQQLGDEPGAKPAFFNINTQGPVQISPNQGEPKPEEKVIDVNPQEESSADEKES